MTVLTPDQRAKMLAATRDMAIAFLEDIQHFRDLLARKEMSLGEIRRASVALRRLLSDRELHELAAPRIGRFLIEMPKPYPAHFPEPWLYVAGGMSIYGMGIADAAVFVGQPALEADMKALHDALSGPEQLLEGRIDNFLSARVLRYANLWITRQQVILYVAHMASGAHSGTPSEPHGRVYRLQRWRFGRRCPLLIGGRIARMVANDAEHVPIE
jgi:hypothetical protein